MNLEPYIYYALPQPTELSEHRCLLFKLL